MLIMKKLYLVLCMALCMVAFTACGNSNKKSSNAKFDEAELKKAYEGTVQEICGDAYKEVTEEDKYEAIVSQFGEDIAQSLKTFVETTKDLGNYQSCEKESFTYSNDNVTVESKVKFEKDTVVVRMVFDKNYKVESFSTELYKTFGQKMIKAALNTVMGMGTVFVVLIFISLMISLLGFVPKLVALKSNEPVQVEQPAAPVQEEVAEEEDDLVSDTELVAVITAAIMASMGEEAPSDGLVVRSIRKVNPKWKNA